MQVTYHCESCNLDKDHVEHTGCVNADQLRAAGLRMPDTIPCPKCKMGMSPKVTATSQFTWYMFRCDSCQQEEEASFKPLDVPDWMMCHSCGQKMERIWKSNDAPSVATSGMYNSTVDVVVGKSAAERWDRVHERQELRNKVRVESGQQGIVATGPDTFKPITREQREARTKVLEVARTKGVGEVNPGATLPITSP